MDRYFVAEYDRRDAINRVSTKIISFQPQGESCVIMYYGILTNWNVDTLAVFHIFATSSNIYIMENIEAVQPISVDNIKTKIYEFRGQKVMLDFDLASLYHVETRTLNQAVKRNIERFPDDFMFRLTSKEWNNMSSQIVMTFFENAYVSVETRLIASLQKKR